MKTIEAIEKREDVEPSEGKSKYGDVDFADEKNKKYPIDTEGHIRAAWNYINKSANAAKYSADDVASIKRKIVAAWKRKIDKDGPPSAAESAYADQDGNTFDLRTKEGTRAAVKHFAKKKNQDGDDADDMMDGDDMDEVRQKLKDACDRFGLDEDGEDVEEEEETPEEEKAESSLVVWAAATTTFDGQAPSQIVYMPKGEWTITPRVNGEPKEVTVTVNQQTAARLQNDFEKRLAQPVRPTGGFDHKPGKASFIPKGFQWDESKGVILNIDWTRAGKDAIEGRDYSYFSPTFLLSDNNRVNGLTKRGEIGSLTNNPAFEQIERIAASADDPDDNPDPDDYMMSTLTKKLREFQIITAQEAEEPEAVVQAVMALNTELVGARAANAALRNENTVLKTEVERVKAKEADSVIEAAIAEGRIPGKDAKLVGYWKAQLIAQPETVKEVIASLPANPALKPLIEVKAGDSKAGISRKIGELVERQKRVVNEIAASQGISHTQAFNKAREERPDLFPAEL